VELLYLRARYYRPEVGRFVSLDLLRGKIDRPRTLHRFSYVLNSPTRFVDPAGLQCSLDIFTGEVECFGAETGMGMTVVPDLRILPAESTPRLSPDLEGIVREEAPKFGVPWQVVAGVLKSELVLDVSPMDFFTNIFYAVMTEEFLSEIWYAPSMSWRDPGPGIGSVHVSAAYNTASYFYEFYPSLPSYHAPFGYNPPRLELGSPGQVTRKLATDGQCNIRVVAAIVRHLADYRFGSCGWPSLRSHAWLSEWTMTDAVAVWHGYRYGVKDISVRAIGFKLEDFQNRSLSLPLLIGVARGAGAEESMRGSIPYFEYYFSRSEERPYYYRNPWLYYPD